MLLQLQLLIRKGLKIFEIADILGIIAFSISGYIVGVRKELDLLGVVLSSFFTALGGGIIRDIIASRDIFAFTDILPGIIVIITIIFAYVFKFHKKDIQNRYFFVLIDSIGLVSFSISGAIVALQSGYNILGVMFLSFITAVGGGILRDVLINEIPFILFKNFYASISLIIGIWIFVFGYGVFSIGIISILGLFLRLYTYKKDFNLPKI